jgi:AcrR family transcriptional regulator
VFTDVKLHSSANTGQWTDVNGFRLTKEADDMARRRNARGEGARLRDDILDGAIALLAESGSDQGLTLRGVARAVEISPQAMYLHFDDLGDLVQAAITQSLITFGHVMTAAADTQQAPLERVLARAAAYVEWGLAHPGLYRVMLEGQAQRSHAPDTVMAGRASFLVARDDVEAAMKDGSVEAGDSDGITIQLWAVLHGLVSLGVNKPHFPWPDRVALAQQATRRLLRLS